MISFTVSTKAQLARSLFDTPKHKADVHTAGPHDPRWLISLLLVMIAVGHIPQTQMHLKEAPYMGVLFILFTATCLLVAAGLALTGSLYWYTLAGGVCLAAVFAYVATRLVAFPQMSDHVGAWTEALALPFVSIELVVACAAALVVRGDVPSSVASDYVARRTPPTKRARTISQVDAGVELHGSTSSALVSPPASRSARW